MSGESIYSWIKEAPPPPEKPPMYHSKHDPLTKPYGASSTFTHVASKKEFGSIGREVKPAVHPTKFLKAHEKTGAAPTDERPLRESARCGDARTSGPCAIWRAHVGDTPRFRPPWPCSKAF